LERKSVGEFGLRVAGVMDSGDSMNFVDSLAASKISKLHRVIFHDEEAPGRLITFRPYSIPKKVQFEEIARRLHEKK